MAQLMPRLLTLTPRLHRLREIPVGTFSSPLTCRPDLPKGVLWLQANHVVGTVTITASAAAPCVVCLYAKPVSRGRLPALVENTVVLIM